MTPLGFASPILPDRSLEEVVGAVGYCGPVCVKVVDPDYEDSLDSRKVVLCRSLIYLRNFCS